MALRRQLDENVVRYPPRNYWRSFIKGLPVSVGMFLAFMVLGFEGLQQYSFVLIAMAVAWFFGTVWQYIGVSRLERDLGTALVEKQSDAGDPPAQSRPPAATEAEESCL